MKQIFTTFVLIFSLLSAEEMIEVAQPTEASVVPKQSSGFKHTLSIYGWLPNLNGNLTFQIPNLPNTPEDPDTPEDGDTATSSLVDTLDMVFMGSYEVRKDKWSLLFDAIYLKLSDSKENSVTLPPLFNQSSLEVSSEQEATMLFLNAYAGYTTIERSNFTLDALVGVRYFYLGVDTTFAVNNRDITLSPSVEFYDGLIGIKGEIALSENWYLPYQFDIGAGDSKLTWQTEASLGYRFDWGDILATYRHIHYDKSDSLLIEEIDIYGPKLGVVFHF